MDKLSLSTPLADVPGIKKQFLPKLRKLGLANVRDLLRHFPSRYEDWSEIADVADLKEEDEKTIQGTVVDIKTRRLFKRRMTISEALISDGTGSITAVWFNQPYIANTLSKGKLVSLAGKASLKNGKLQLSNPTYEVVPRNAELKHTAGLIPIYPETRGLTSRGIRYILQPILERALPVKEFLPDEVLEKMNLPEINTALREIHTPDSVKTALHAKERFAFQDLFLLQMRNELERRTLQKEKAYPVKVNSEALTNILDHIPFEMTLSQKSALDDILKDMQKSHPMNRLLQGDVGSGKTIVVGAAALLVSDTPNNLQSALMAPTEILARQHYKTLTELFGYFSGGIGLLTGKEVRVFYGDGLESKITKPKFIKEVSAGNIRVVIGTHALIQRSITFKNLGYVIIDEQQRFGVRQRAELIKSSNFHPHFLSMSATPIPRTLTMTIFGNLDVSLITELPKGRKKIITKIVDPANKAKAYAFIRGEVQKGRQVYVVCPRIEVSENVDPNKKTPWDDVKAVEAEFEHLSKEVFPDLRVDFLHGKLKSIDKSATMEKFQKGETDLIVTTSVIEVGVDVPNATIMMIEDAGHFGLAQLYQFRGRVGRGGHQSFCLLFTESHSDSTHKRLSALVDAKNGFELAEKDLEIRGPGEFLGESQTGLPDIAMIALQNPKMLEEARKLVSEIFTKDPDLSEHPHIKERLEAFSEEVHLE